MNLEELKQATLASQEANTKILQAIDALNTGATMVANAGATCEIAFDDGVLMLSADISGLMQRSGPPRAATMPPVGVTQITPIAEGMQSLAAPLVGAECAPLVPVPSVQPHQVETPEPDVGEEHGTPNPAPLKSGEWELDELILLKEHWDAGLTISEIADRLHRELKSVTNKIFRMRQQGKLADRDTAPSGKTVPPKAKPKRPSLAQTLDRLKYREADVAAWDDYLEALPDDEDWTPERDLNLLQSILAGRDKGVTAHEIGCSWADCVARFKTLHPMEPSIKTQEALLKALRARAEV